MLVRRRSAIALCAVLILVAVASGGCGSGFVLPTPHRAPTATPTPTPTPRPTPTPTPTPISDANEIIIQSLSGLEHVQTLHIDGKLSGSIDVGKLNGLPGGFLTRLIGKVKLDGSTLAGDVDITNRSAHITASVPNLLGLTLDYIVVDGYQYTKVNLTGQKYTKTPMSSVLPGVDLTPSASLKIAERVGTFKAELDRAGVTAGRAGRDIVDGRVAHRVTLSIPVDKFNQAIGSLGGSLADGVTFESVSVDYWAYVDTLLPAMVEAKATSASLGSLDLTVTATKYNQQVTIAAPPDSQVQAG
jgi:hypothetical protein